MFDNLPVAELPPGFTGLGGLDGRIDTPGFARVYGLLRLLRLEVVVGPALQATPLIPFAN